MSRTCLRPLGVLLSAAAVALGSTWLAAPAGAAPRSAPSVSLGAPRSVGGPAAVSGVIGLSAAAGDRAGIAKVVFLADNKRVGEDTTAPYTVSWDTRRWADRAWGVQALAISRSGGATYSPATPVRIGNARPTVVLSGPRTAAGTPAVSGTATVSAVASHPAGIAKVVFLADNKRIGEDATAPYSTTWDTRPWADRPWALQALAISRSGTAAITAVNRTLVGNAAPAVSLSSPGTAGASVSGTLSVTAQAAHPAGIAKLVFLADGQRIGEDATAPYAVSWNTTGWSERPWTLRAMAISRSGTATLTSGTPVTPNNSQMWTDLFGLNAAPAHGIFGPASFWKQRLADAPVAPTSAQIVAGLSAQVAKLNGGVASLNVWQYTAQMATAVPGTPRVRVTFDDCQRKGYTPRGLYGADGVFEDVPVPDNAVPSIGNDSSLSIWSPSTDQFWSLWRMKRLADGWHACWGGRIDSVSTSPGYFPNGFGASATGTAGIGGMLSIRDVQYGRADHALAIGIPDPASWKTFSWPAQRSDGSASSKSLVMEGQRFRLDPSVDVDSLRLSPIGRIVAHAAQDYGLIVTDKSGTVALGVESGTMVERATGTNPWRNWLNTSPKGMDKSYNTLKNFPWDRLQALPKDYGKPIG